MKLTSGKVGGIILFFLFQILRYSGNRHNTIREIRKRTFLLSLQAVTKVNALIAPKFVLPQVRIENPQSL